MSAQPANFRVDPNSFRFTRALAIILAAVLAGIVCDWLREDRVLFPRITKTEFSTVLNSP